jgi:signal transduction histidine kinase
VSAPRRWPPWTVAEGPFGVRPLDLGIVALVVLATEINVQVGNGPGAVALNWKAYLFGALLAAPIAFRHRYPLRTFAAVTALVLVYYLVARRNISPAPALMVPVYDAAVAGYLIPAIAVPAFYMSVGAVIVQLSTKEGFATLISDFGPQVTLCAFAVVLGELVRSRHALAAETARRLELAEVERAAEAARLVAEERLRIARELHDTVAHSMATIAVQAGSALHLLKDFSQNNATASLQSALTAIRSTSKSALTETRAVLGQLRGSSPVPGLGTGHGLGLGTGTGLERLPALRDAVSAAGTRVTVEVEGAPVALPAQADHAAYRILQESLTNVLRHAGPGAAATVALRYGADAVTITVTDDGAGGLGAGRDDMSGSAAADGGGSAAADGGGSAAADGGGSAAADGGGQGIAGMAERAAAVGGSLRAGPLADGGFSVTATLPVTVSS